MNDLKLKINRIESEIQANYQSLINQEKLLIDKINSIKNNLFYFKLLASAFILGYLLAPKSKRIRFARIRTSIFKPLIKLFRSTF